MWEPLAIQPCYYVPVTSMISGAIVGCAAQYMWLLYRTISNEEEHYVCSLVILKPDLFIVSLKDLFSVYQSFSFYENTSSPGLYKLHN